MARIAFKLVTSCLLALFISAAECAAMDTESGYIPALPPILIAKIQETLTAQGFNAGGADGKWGPKTRQAVTDFRTQKGLPAGDDVEYLTPDLVKALWNIDLPDQDGSTYELSEAEQTALLEKLELLTAK